jgi:hypothetical protein
MRLAVSKNAAQEAILRQLQSGYEMAMSLRSEYNVLRASGEFKSEVHFASMRSRLSEWVNSTAIALQGIFPSDLEANMFALPFSVSSASYTNMHPDVGMLLEARIPEYLQRLHGILEKQLPFYTGLPLSERLYVEDVDSFSQVRDVNPALVADALNEGRVERSEDAVQMALEAILDVPFHRADWGGEINDLYTANLQVNGRRTPTAFLLKGGGLRAPEMQLSHCGKNGDQVVRLFQSPAELFVVQYVGPISDAVIEDVCSKVRLRRAEGRAANFLIMDGQDTARLLKAYGHL